MRVPVIAGNWKMYKTAGEAAAFVRAFLPLVSSVRGVEIVLAPPYPSIAAVAELVRGGGRGLRGGNARGRRGRKEVRRGRAPARRWMEGDPRLPRAAEHRRVRARVGHRN